MLCGRLQCVSLLSVFSGFSFFFFPLREYVYIEAQALELYVTFLKTSGNGAAFSQMSFMLILRKVWENGRMCLLGL